MLNLLTNPVYGYGSSRDARPQTALCPSKVGQLRSKHCCSIHLGSGDDTGFEVENRDGSFSCVGSLKGKRSSGGGNSNVDRWFEQHDAEDQKYNTSSVGSNPHIFPNDVPSSEASSALQKIELRQDTGVDSHHSLQARAGLLQLRTDAISTEAFRSIVDDLTIEIKTLKRKLESHDDIHNQDSGNEKLFELRVFSLKADKKRELEGILHRFVGGLSDRRSVEFAPNNRGVILPDAKPHGAACSQVSTLDVGSARASVSTSVHSFPQPASDGTHVNIPQTDRVKAPNIHSNTKHTDECMQPRENLAAMTMHAKRKCVVYRLEQLFAGQDVLTGPRPPALQQQQCTSHGTTRAEHSAILAWDQQTISSGLHKVSALNNETKDSVNATTPDQLEALRHEAVGDQMSGRAAQRHYTGHHFDSTPETKRPTGQLSLDPDHSQLIAENIRYIHHLGFSPNDLKIDGPPGEEYEWIYLNILVNMAQLHTLNVTHDFIRKAISELSGHYIISKDGRKVRWKSSWSLAKKRRHDDNSPGHQIDGSAVGKRVSKKLKAAHYEDSRTSPRTGRQCKHAPSTWRPHQGNSKLMYTPLFYHGPTEDVANHLFGESMPLTHWVHGDSPVADRPDVVTASKKDRNGRSGSRIIFYNNTQFYTDLDGEISQYQDSETSSRMESTLKPDCKEDCSGHGFKMMSENSAPFEDTKGDKELKGPTSLVEGSISETIALEFPLPAAPRSFDGKTSLHEINFEVTGLGGTYPADNFAIDVQTHYTPVHGTEVPISSLRTAATNLPERFARILRAGMPQSEVRTTFYRRVLDMGCTELPPSELPPALLFSLVDDESVVDDSSGSDAEISASFNL
jgi:hypothetical protein